MKVKFFPFNPFQENTYIVSDNTNECIIIDPGCIENREKSQLDDYIKDNQLKPVKLINTHCHLDHIFGNQYISKKYNLPLEIHPIERQTLELAANSAQNYGFPVPETPEKIIELSENDSIEFGSSKLQIIFTPGHAPGHISLYDPKTPFVISGDVLFQNSIGRTDLPGGDFDTLIKSIKEKLFVLPDECIVYTGHGPETSIGFEKLNNPFLN